jgi:glycosyltransferase involved in cell wall biosynthesis
MRICMVCPTYPPNAVPCGVGDYTREVCERLAAPDISITVVASTLHGPEPGAPVTVIPFARRWDLKTMIALVRMVRRERFDLLHLQYTPELFGRLPWMKLLPFVLAISGGPPVILTTHTVVGGYLAAKLLAPLLLGFSQRIICPNDEASRLISRYLPFVRSRIREIPIGSNIPGPSHDPETTRKTVRTEFSLSEECCLLSHFGFAYPGKGIETLLAASARLQAAGVKFALLMIGGAWPGAEAYYEGLQGQCRAAGLMQNVVWLGHCERARVAALLEASDIYVVPYENGITFRRGTLLAGLAHHLPIVSTYPQGPNRRLRDRENVVLVPPGDPLALAKALGMLIASPELRQKIRRGAHLLSQEFSWTRIAADTVVVYREVCS